MRSYKYWFPAALMALCFLSTTLIPGRASAAPDNAAPRVLHTLVANGVIGQNIDVHVQFQDQSEIFEPKLYFRRSGELEYAAIDLAPRAKGDWVGTIPATFVTRDVEYFLEAFDIMGNGPGRSGSPEKPYVVKVSTRIASTEQPRNVKQSGTYQGQQAPLNNTPGLTQAAAQAPTPVYKSWWLWTIVGVVVAGGVTVGVLAGAGAFSKSKPITSVTINVVGPDPRVGL